MKWLAVVAGAGIAVGAGGTLAEAAERGAKTFRRYTAGL
jgi:hypothetical protein